MAGLAVGAQLVYALFKFRILKPGRHPREEWPYRRPIGAYARRGERGNMFFMLFGAVAMVGVVGAGVMGTMRGPMSTMVEINRIEETKATMRVGIRMIAAASGQAALDPDGDNVTEPLEPDGGSGGVGGVPASTGAPSVDSWGTALRYCAWDVGMDTGDLGDNDGEGNRIAGSDNYNDVVFALVSAGPDRQFHASNACNAFPAIPLVNTGNLVQGDDIIVALDYNEANAASGGLWEIQPDDPGATGAPEDFATIGENLNVTDTGTSYFGGGADFGGAVRARSSVLLPDDGELSSCGPGNDKLVRVNDGPANDQIPVLEVCDGSSGIWEPASGMWAADAGGINYQLGNVGIGKASTANALDVAGITQLETLNASGAASLTSTLSVSSTSQLSGNVGIGKAPTANALDVAGSVVFDSTLEVSGTSTLTGNVGIGTAPGADALDVAGDVNANSIKLDGDTALDNAGSSSIFVGQGAASGTSGPLNTVVGAGAAPSLSDGEGNIILGAGTSDGSGAIVAGTVPNTPAGGSDNYLTIGNALIGDIATGDLTIQGSDGSAGSLSTGTVNADNYNYNGNDMNPPSCTDAYDFARWTGTQWECADVSAAVGGSSGVMNFIDLDDTPSSYDAGKLVRSTGSGVEFFSCANNQTLHWTGSAWDCTDGTSLAGAGKWEDAAGTGDDIKYNPAGSDNDVIIGADTAGGVDASSSADLYVEGWGSAMAYMARNGTEASPSYVFVNDYDTGLFTGGADMLGLSTAGTQRMVILPNGDIGIGTATVATGSGTNPQDLLMAVSGPLGATYYCDADGNNCFDPANIGDDVLGNLGCTANQIVTFDGSAWVCTDAPSGGNPPTTDGLVAYYTMDESLGANVPDSVGSNDGTHSNATPAWLPSGGQVNGAIDIDGAGNERIEAGNWNITGGSGGFTIAFWVQPGSYAAMNDGRIISKTDGSAIADHDWAVYLNPSTWEVNVRTGGENHGLEGFSLNEGTWFHVAATYDPAAAGAELTYYIDGVLQGTDDHGSGGPVATSAKDVAIGNNPASASADRPFDGLLDELRVYNRPLTATEVAGLFQGFTDNDTLAGLSCTDGEIAKVSGGVWACQADDSAAIPACAADQVLEHDGTDWQCVNDESVGALAGLSCTDGQVASWDDTGSAWICADVSGGGGGGSGGSGTFRASGGTATSVSLNVITDLTEDYDPNAVWDESGSADQFKPTDAGEYYLYMTGYGDNCDASDSPTFEIWMNGSTQLSHIQGSSSGNNADIPMSVHTVVQMNGTTDYIEFFARDGSCGLLTDIRAGGFSIGSGGGGFGSDTLAGLNCANNKIAKWNGSAWACAADAGITSETDPTVPANIKDGVDWSELSGIPASFADGTDDVGVAAPPVCTGTDKALQWDGSNWSCATIAGGGGSGSFAPNPFDFTDVSDAVPHTQYTDSVTVTGFSGGQIASVTGHDAQIRNATHGTDWASGAIMVDGETLEIRMDSNASFGGVATTTVTFGTATVDWTITTVASGPSGCSSIGDVCNDGSVFGGDGNMYVTDVNQSNGIQWSTENVNTGADSTTDGMANHQWIVNNETLSQYPAFELCENLNRHGHADWYLPARDELRDLEANKGAIGGFNPTYYFSSSERSNSTVRHVFFDSGFELNYVQKTGSFDVRCVRRD